MLLVLLLVIYILSRIKVAGPNEAFIVTGRKGRADRRRPTASWPPTCPARRSSWARRSSSCRSCRSCRCSTCPAARIHVEIQGAVSKQGIRANLQGVAIVKVGGTEDAIRAAAQRFLHQQAEIEEFTREVLAGALRSIVGRLTIEEIIRDRAAFASAVAEEAEHSMTNQGLVLDTFQLQDILAEGIVPAGPRPPRGGPGAQGRRDRRGAAPGRQAEQARLLAEEAIAEAQPQPGPQAGRASRPRSTRRRRSPRRPARWPRPSASRLILAEQQKVAERNAELKQRQLDTEVRKPADAARYKVEQEAEAPQERRDRRRRRPAPGHHRRRAGRRPSSRASPVRASGRGPRWPRRTRSRAPRRARPSSARTAIADASSGRAGRGAAILAKGKAEAEAMQRKAEAFAAYGEAAVLDLLVRVLPQVVEAAAAPIARDRQDDRDLHRRRLVADQVASPSNVAQGLQLGTDLTGIDLTQLLARLSGMASGERRSGNGNEGTARPGPAAGGDGRSTAEIDPLRWRIRRIAVPAGASVPVPSSIMQAALAPEPVRRPSAPQPACGARAARVSGGCSSAGCSASSATAGSRPAWPAACSSTRRRRPRRSRSPRRSRCCCVPYSTLGPFVGVFLDRWSRRRACCHREPDPGRPGAAGRRVRLVRRQEPAVRHHRPRSSSPQPVLPGRAVRLAAARGGGGAAGHGQLVRTTAGTVTYAVGLVSAATVVRTRPAPACTRTPWSRPRRRSATPPRPVLISSSFRSRRPRARRPERHRLGRCTRCRRDRPGHGRRAPPPGPAAGRRALMTVQAVHRLLYGVLALTTLLLYRNYYAVDDMGALADRPAAGRGGRRGRRAAGGGAHAAA